MINKLYSLLVADRLDTSGMSTYAKRTSTVWHTERSSWIHDILLPDTSEYRAKLPLFASVICYEVLATQYGDEIRSLDPNNTYAAVLRPDADISADYCIAPLTHGADYFNQLLPYLDEDIATRLVTPAWIEFMAAGCLQMLRECF